MSLSRFACWTLERAADAIAIDATESSDAVFLATHHPAHIRRRPFQQAAGGELCTEEQVRKFVLSEPADPLIIPVVGQSGSGKSHLVRWLKASFATADDRLHVVHIPKYETSLKRVIERVITGFDNEDFNEVRERLAGARDGLVEAEAPGKLLNDLARGFEYWRPQPDDGSDLPYFEHLAGRRGMAQLLYDEVFREPLLADGGTVQRFVTQALHGKSAVDRGEPLRFDPDDLLPNPTNLREAASGVRKLYGDLLGDRKLRELAAAKLTEFLQPAVRDLIGVDAQAMGTLFQRVRELLGAEGKELILLIEDFTVLQAIQRELLDALLIPARQEGRATFCPLRTVLAVTTGYFHSLEFDTVRTRIRYVLDLDVPLDRVGAASQENFAGRYLNAARLGAGALEAAARNALTNQDQGWVPNACDDCPHKGPCHEAFGSTELGHGLYPFNTAALSRCLRSQLGRPDVQGRFDPRVVLKDVLEYVLVTHLDPIANGTFPNNRFSKHFKSPEAPELGAMVEQDIEAHDPDTATRRKVLLTFWGNTPQKLIDLPLVIHDAFDISPAGVEESSRSDTNGDARRPPPPPPEPVISQLDHDLQDFAKWRKGESLPQVLERRLRGLVHGSVVAHMDWERLVLAPRSWTDPGKPFSTRRVLFRDSPHENPGFIFLTIDRESASDAAAIEALLRYEQHGNWSFENGARSFRSLRLALDGWAAGIRERLHAIQEADRVAFENAIHALILGAIVGGLVDARSATAEELIDAIFASVPQTPTDSGDAWGLLLKACTVGRGATHDSRENLQKRVIRFAGTSKGGSGPQVIDAATILPVLLKRVVDLETAPAELGSDAASRHLRHVLDLLPRAVAARRAKVQECLTAISAWCDPRHLNAENVVQVVLGTIDRARASSVRVEPTNAFQLLERYGTRFVSHDPATLWREIATGLNDFDAWEGKDRLSFLARQSEEALLDVTRFVDLSDRIIGDLEARIVAEGDGNIDLPSRIESAIEQLHREFERTGLALEGVSQIGLGGSE